jgi:hypothetical protein
MGDESQGGEQNRSLSQAGRNLIERIAGAGDLCGAGSGSDAWKAYMRRKTVTVNWSGKVSLAQGIELKLMGS